MNDDMYKEVILDNYHNPMNKGRIENPDYHSFESNPICGDEMEIFIKEENGNIDEIKFDGKGCAISIASASLVTEKIKGMRLSDIRNMNENDVMYILGIDLGPSRIKCATLILDAIKSAIRT